MDQEFIDKVVSDFMERLQLKEDVTPEQRAEIQQRAKSFALDVAKRVSENSQLAAAATTVDFKRIRKRLDARIAEARADGFIVDGVEVVCDE